MDKIKGLKKIAGESKKLKRGCYLQVNYDTKSRQVWADYIADFTHNSWVQYADPNVIRICNVVRPITMEELEDVILSTLDVLESM